MKPHVIQSEYEYKQGLARRRAVRRWAYYLGMAILTGVVVFVGWIIVGTWMAVAGA